MPEQTSSLEHALGRLADSLNRQTTAIEAVHARIGTMEREIVSAWRTGNNNMDRLVGAIEAMSASIRSVHQESVLESSATEGVLCDIEAHLKDISIAIDLQKLAA